MGVGLFEHEVFIPLSELGPDQESWGMKDGGGGRLVILDKPRQHKAYAEAGSFGAYLFSAFGSHKIKEFHRISHQRERPWQEVFGKGLEELEAHWIQTLGANAKRGEGNVPLILKMLDMNPDEACVEAQRFQGKPAVIDNRERLTDNGSRIK